jgi:N-methylhydantoinase A
MLTDPATGAADSAAIHARASLAPGATLRGPALIIEDETTTIIPKHWTARINAGGQIILEHAP